MERTYRLRSTLTAILAMGAIVLVARHVAAQAHERAADGSPNSMLHMQMTAERTGTSTDSARAAGVAALLRDALAPYADTTAAVRDGYQMFMPQVKTQKVYHFTNKWNAVKEAFRFDPAKPTSLLYRKESDGRFMLVGAMYTTPKRFSPDKLDARVPLSVARWHKHVNWCIPQKDQASRWREQRDGHAVFGPESPIATKAACDAVDGVFHETVFGWMLHANVFAGNDPKTIWGDEHAAHDMHDGMKMSGEPQ
ncbi:hypothetical protein BH09GEM1_BH09GEM1_42310 [soil metagenome]